MNNDRIYHLEDTSLSTVRVKEELEGALAGIEVKSFSERFSLEEAWLKKEYPKAVIIDLLVPERHKFLARIVLSRRLRYRIMRWPLVWYASKTGKISKYLADLRADLADERDTDWGGLEFLRSLSNRGKFREAVRGF